MDPKFQTSFIPKKPSAGGEIERPSSASIGSTFSILSFVATTVFIVALVLGGALFAYEQVLTDSLAKQAQDLQIVEEKLDSPVFAELLTASQQMKIVKLLLEKHIMVSRVFELLQADTLPTVKISSFQFKPDTDGSMMVELKGETQSYGQLGRQMSVFRESESIKSPTLNDLKLKDTGNIEMKITGHIDQKLVSYPEFIKSLSLNI